MESNEKRKEEIKEEETKQEVDKVKRIAEDLQKEPSKKQLPEPALGVASGLIPPVH